MKSILIKDTTREEREQIVKQSLWGSCGAECEFFDGLKEIAEINAEYTAPFVR